MGFNPIKLATDIATDVWEKPGWLDYVLPISATKDILRGEGDVMDYVDVVSTLLPWGAAAKVAKGGIKGFSAMGPSLHYGSGGANLFARKMAAANTGMRYGPTDKVAAEWGERTREALDKTDARYPDSVFGAFKGAKRRVSPSKASTRIEHLLDEPINELDDNKLRFAMDLVTSSDAKAARISDSYREDFAQGARAFILERKRDGASPTVREVRDHLQKEWDGQRGIWRKEVPPQGFHAEDGEFVAKERDGAHNLLTTNFDAKTFPVAPTGLNKVDKLVNELKGNEFVNQSPVYDAPVSYTTPDGTKRLLGRQGSMTDVSEPFRGQIPSRSWEDFYNSQGEMRMGLASWKDAVARAELEGKPAPPRPMLGNLEAGISSPTIDMEKLGELAPERYLSANTSARTANLRRQDTAHSFNKAEEYPSETYSVGGLPAPLHVPEPQRITQYANRLLEDAGWLRRNAPKGVSPEEFASRPSTFEQALRDAERHLVDADTTAVLDPVEMRGLGRSEGERMSRLVKARKKSEQPGIYTVVGGAGSTPSTIDKVQELAASRAKGSILRVLGSYDKRTGWYDEAAYAAANAAHEAGGVVQVVKPWGSAKLPPGMRASAVVDAGIPYEPDELLSFLKQGTPQWRAPLVLPAQPEGEHLRKMLTLSFGQRGYNNLVKTLERNVEIIKREPENALEYAQREKALQAVGKIRSAVQFRAQGATLFAGRSGESPIAGAFLAGLRPGDRNEKLLPLIKMLNVKTKDLAPAVEKAGRSNKWYQQSVEEILSGIRNNPDSVPRTHLWSANKGLLPKDYQIGRYTAEGMGTHSSRPGPSWQKPGELKPNPGYYEPSTYTSNNALEWWDEWRTNIHSPEDGIPSGVDLLRPRGLPGRSPSGRPSLNRSQDSRVLDALLKLGLPDEVGRLTPQQRAMLEALALGPGKTSLPIRAGERSDVQGMLAKLLGLTG